MWIGKPVLLVLVQVTSPPSSGRAGLANTVVLSQTNKGIVSEAGAGAAGSGGFVVLAAATFTVFVTRLASTSAWTAVWLIFLQTVEPPSGRLMLLPPQLKLPSLSS